MLLLLGHQGSVRRACRSFLLFHVSEKRALEDASDKGFVHGLDLDDLEHFAADPFAVADRFRVVDRVGVAADLAVAVD